MSAPRTSAHRNRLLRSGRRARAGRDGFALLYVLLMTSFVCAGVIVITSLGRSAAGHAQAELRATKDRLALEAGTTRALFAVSRRNDPLNGDLTESRRLLVWDFAGHRLEVSLRPEGGRIDLNAAAPALLQSLFRAYAATPERGQRWFDRTLTMRAEGRMIRSVMEVLDHCERLQSRLGRLRDATTIWTRLPTIDPRWIDPSVANSLLAEADDELRLSLSAALDSPNRFVADGYVNVSSGFVRLTIVQSIPGSEKTRSEVLLRIKPASPGFSIVSFETLRGSFIPNLCE